MRRPPAGACDMKKKTKSRFYEKSVLGDGEQTIEKMIENSAESNSNAKENYLVTLSFLVLLQKRKLTHLPLRQGS